jgi:hypothetical protein
MRIKGKQQMTTFRTNFKETAANPALHSFSRAGTATSLTSCVMLFSPNKARLDSRSVDLN